MKNLKILIVNVIIIIIASLSVIWVSNFIFDFETQYYKVIIFGLVTLWLIPYMTYNETGLYVLHILMDLITHKERIIEPGFGLKLPWEVITEPEPIDEAAEIKSIVRDTFPVIGGTVLVEFVIAAKANFRDDDEKIIPEDVLEYARFSKTEREKMHESRGRQLAREALKNKTPEEAQDLKQEDIFYDGCYNEIEKKLKTKVIKTQLVDLDLDDATKKENEAKFRTKVMVDNKNKLVDQGNFDKKFAEEIAASMDGAIKTTREQKEINIPGLFDGLAKIAEKFFENKNS